MISSIAETVQISANDDQKKEIKPVIEDKAPAIKPDQKKTLLVQNSRPAIKDLIKTPK